MHEEGSVAVEQDVTQSRQLPASIGRVLIVGGGLAGLAGAIGLRRAEVEVVDVLEISTESTVNGLGIVQHSNAFRSLAELGLAEQILEAGWPVVGRRVHDVDGRVLDEFDTPNLLGGDYPAGSGIARPKLYQILEREVRRTGARLRRGVTVTSFNETDSGITVEMTDGATAVYDLVIGADGIRSQVRRMLFGDVFEPRYTGQVCWRCNVPRIEGVDRTWSFTGGLGKAGFVPISREEMYLYFLENADPDQTRIPDDKLADVLRQRLAGYGGPMAQVRDRAIAESRDIVCRPVEEVVVPLPWHQGRIVLVGDAVHATSPDLGVGSALAYEDILVLIESLGDAERTVEQSLEAFASRRFPRVRALCELSREVQELSIKGVSGDQVLTLLRAANEHMAKLP